MPSTAAVHHHLAQVGVHALPLDRIDRQALHLGEQRPQHAAGFGHRRVSVLPARPAGAVTPLLVSTITPAGVWSSVW